MSEYTTQQLQRFHATLERAKPDSKIVTDNYVWYRFVGLPWEKLDKVQGHKNPYLKSGVFYQKQSALQAQVNRLRSKDPEEADRLAACPLLSDEEAAKLCYEKRVFVFKNHAKHNGDLKFHNNCGNWEWVVEMIKKQSNQSSQKRTKYRCLNVVVPLRPFTAGVAAAAPPQAVNEAEAQRRLLREQQDAEYAAAETADRTRHEAEQRIADSDLEVARQARLRRFEPRASAGSPEPPRADEIPPQQRPR